MESWIHTFNLLQDFLDFMLTAITVYIDFKDTSLHEQAKTEHTHSKAHNFNSHRTKPADINKSNEEEENRDRKPSFF